MILLVVNLEPESVNKKVSEAFAAPIFSINRNTILNSDCDQFNIN
jgi:hypothetical protein